MTINAIIPQNLVEHQSTAIVCLSATHDVLYINQAAQMLFDVSARQITGHTIHDIVKFDAPTQARLAQVQSTGAPYTEWERTLTLIDGKQLTLDWTITPLRITEEEDYLLLEILAVNQQVSSIREEKLRDQHAISRELVRGLAHEIKNPLGGLRGAAQLLAGELHDPALHEYTDIIIQEADRLRSMVDRLLGPNRPPKKIQLNIHEILEHVRNLLIAEVGDAIIVKRDYDTSLPEIQADREQLIQATLNLVRNAMQSCRDQPQQAVITLRTRIARQVVIGETRHRLALGVDIIDNGPGIPADLQERIFYPTVSGRPDGSGLGLSIAQALITHHNGAITCDSRPGHTLFRLLIPFEMSKV